MDEHSDSLSYLGCSAFCLSLLERIYPVFHFCCYSQFNVIVSYLCVFSLAEFILCLYMLVNINTSALQVLLFNN